MPAKQKDENQIVDKSTSVTLQNVRNKDETQGKVANENAVCTDDTSHATAQDYLLDRKDEKTRIISTVDKPVSAGAIENVKDNHNVNNSNHGNCDCAENQENGNQDVEDVSISYSPVDISSQVSDAEYQVKDSVAEQILPLEQSKEFINVDEKSAPIKTSDSALSNLDTNVKKAYKKVWAAGVVECITNGVLSEVASNATQPLEKKMNDDKIRKDIAPQSDLQPTSGESQLFEEKGHEIIVSLEKVEGLEPEVNHNELTKEDGYGLDDATQCFPEDHAEYPKCAQDQVMDLVNVGNGGNSK